MPEAFVRPQHDLTVRLIKEVGKLTGGLDQIDHVMLLYMVTAIAQVPYLLTAEMKYAHGINAMRETTIEAHCDAVLAFIFR